MAKYRFVDYLNSFQFIEIVEDGDTYKIHMRGKLDNITGLYKGLNTDQLLDEPTYWVVFQKNEKQNIY
jgi:hypothetical protein